MSRHIIFVSCYMYIYIYCHVINDERQFGLAVKFIEHFNTQLMTTLYRSLSHRVVFSVMVFTVLLGSGFQQWTFLCFGPTYSQAGWQSSHTNCDWLSGCMNLTRQSRMSLLFSITTPVHRFPPFVQAK
jgi:hypothetical protein